MQQNQAYYLQHENNHHNWFGLAGTVFIHGIIFLLLYLIIDIRLFYTLSKKNRTSLRF